MNKVVFSLIFLTNILLAVECPFDEKYAVDITRCEGMVFPPSIYDYYHPDEWKAVVYIYFGNGLWGTKEWRAKQESQAKQYSEFTYKGRVNILAKENYRPSMVQEGSASDAKYPIRLEALFIDTRCFFGSSPIIRFITERIETKTSWFFADSYVYHYTIELSDGTLWNVQPRSEPLQDFWLVGHRVVPIGNFASPCLVNVDASLAKSRTVIFLELLPLQVNLQ